MIGNLKGRVERLEKGAGMNGVDYVLPNGAHARIKNRDVLAAAREAIFGPRSIRANILLRAESASDGSRLHELCQALAAGPVKSNPATQENTQ